MDERLIYEILSVVEEVPAGRTAPGWADQRRLLEAEGVPFAPTGHVDMKRCQWTC